MLRLPWKARAQAADAPAAPMARRPIILVSGLPRSGTSMMMQALSAGGVPVLTDSQRTADWDNPRGYLEFARVKAIEYDKSWLAQAQGKAVKMISALLRHLPPEYEYKIIFMRRALAEVLASQQAMLRRRGVQSQGSDARLAVLFETHLAYTASWLAQQPNMQVLCVDYHAVLADPRTELARVRAFLHQELKLDAMVAAIDPRLHRQRAGRERSRIAEE